MAAPFAHPKVLTESAWQRRVLDTARVHGWRVVHIRPAQTVHGWRTPYEGDPGLPDLILARAGVVLLAELKTDTGAVTAEQRAWLAAAGPNGRLWRPAHWDAVLAELSTPTRTGTETRNQA